MTVAEGIGRVASRESSIIKGTNCHRSKVIAGLKSSIVERNVS